MTTPSTNIGRCWSCVNADCPKPRQPSLNPSEGCADWLSGKPLPEMHVETVEDEE